MLTNYIQGKTLWVELFPWDGCCVGRIFGLLFPEYATPENDNGVELVVLLLFCHDDCVVDRFWNEVEEEVFWNQLGKLGGGLLILLPPRWNPRLRPRPRPRSKLE